jgi:murein L,D-transpeptidase YafK
MLFDEGALHRGATGVPACWPAALALDYPAGQKQREGDRKTPEGWYRTSDKPTSQFYGAIAVHYPNVQDADAGLARGQITKARRDAISSADARGTKPPQYSSLGGEILVHGGGNFPDWTLGCVALENADLDRLRGLLPAGMKTDILILP